MAAGSAFGALLAILKVAQLDDAAVGPEDEEAVEEGCGRGDDGAGYGGGAPVIALRGGEIIGDAEKAEGGGAEGGSVVVG